MLMEFEQVEYSYPCSQDFTLKKLSLKIPENKCCAVIGRNGCGKTTLFRLANGLYRPQKGVIRFLGEKISYNRTALDKLRQQVGLVFQDPEQQLVASTVEEDISYGLCNLGLENEEIKMRVQEILQQFDLLELADTPIHYLSLGQKKRVSLADVMVLKPKLLLLDEPTAYLDPYQTRNLLNILDNIQATGTTVVIATHNLDLVYSWADWIFVINQGQLVLEGIPETVFQEQEIMQNLNLGLPIAINLLQTITTRISQDNYNFASQEWQKTIRRYL